jgi:hypothetical protein
MHLRTMPSVEGDELVATVNPDENPHRYGSVRHRLGTERIFIKSNVPGWGFVPIEGPEALAMVRDALTEICARLGIPDSSLVP